MPYNLRNYALCKAHYKNLPEILKRMETAIQQLEPYSRYRAVKNALLNLKDNKAVLQTHMIQIEKVISSKGKVKE